LLLLLLVANNAAYSTVLAALRIQGSSKTPKKRSGESPCQKVLAEKVE
jgi:hypothetical protein